MRRNQLGGEHLDNFPAVLVVTKLVDNASSMSEISRRVLCCTCRGVCIFNLFLGRLHE